MYILRDRIKGYLQHPIFKRTIIYTITDGITCLLYTSDAADD